MILQEALADYADFGNDVAGSDYQDFDNNLRRFMSLFDSDQPLGQFASELLPPVAFDDWYTRCQATGGSIVGSGTLEWPLPRREKVALQLELLRRLASGAIGFLSFSSRFCYESNSLNANVHKFVASIFRPFLRDFLRTLQAASPRPEAVPVETNPAPNVIDEERLDELRRLPTARFDFARLIRLCEELNTAYRQRCYHAVALLTRAILDHVPPVFGLSTFAEVASNHGSRSFKGTVEHLQHSARKIADAYLHTPIRDSEVLPNATQVNCSNSLDVLLAEVVRVARVPR